MFSGIGGFDLAFRNQGHEIVGACEIDEYARRIYRKQFPGVTIHNDATNLHPQSLPSFDVLCAGFPCQAFSIAGKRRGFDDTRGSLFFEIARVAKEKKPSFLLLENVKGLLSHDKGQTFRTIIRTLDEVGYDVEWQLLNSKYFVPQNRERVFIIGHLRGKRTRQVFPLGDFDEISDKKKLRKEELSRSRSHSSAIDANYYKGPDGKRTLVQVGNIDTKGHNSLWGRVYDPEGIAPNLNANGGGMGAKTGLYSIDSKIRRLTPKECERLQGFPDNWTIGSDTQRYKCCGNAVTVPVIEYIITHLRTI